MTPRERLYEYPHGREFVAFVEQADLFEHRHFNEVQALLDELDLDPDSETAYLATFAYTAGGWTSAVPRTLVGNMGVRSLGEAVSAADAGGLDGLREHTEHHPHRRRFHATRIVEVLAELENLGAPSFVEWARRLRVNHSDPTQRFLEALSDVRRIPTIKWVASFDWLELVVRVQARDWLGPERFEPVFLRGGHPSDGFERAFGFGTASDRASEAFRLLIDYGKSLGLDATEAIFELESCLCMFAHQDFQDLETELDSVPTHSC